MFLEAQPREWAPPANSSSEALGNNSEVKRSGFAAAIGTRNGKQNTLGACTLMSEKTVL